MTSEDLELTHLLCESLLISDAQINPEGEEAALTACSRLRHTVDTLLELLNQANAQVKPIDIPIYVSQNNIFCRNVNNLGFLFSSWSRLMASTCLWRKSSLRAERTPPTSSSSTSSYWNRLIRRRSKRANCSCNFTRLRVSTVSSLALFPLNSLSSAYLQYLSHCLFTWFTVLTVLQNTIQNVKNHKFSVRISNVASSFFSHLNLLPFHNVVRATGGLRG